jgi:uncharacterized protein
MTIRTEPWPQGTPSWVDLAVDDPAAASAFYAALFGWTYLEQAPETEGYRIALLDGQMAAGIGPKPQGMPMPSSWTTYLAADDADAIAEKAQAAGGTVIAPAFDVMDAGRMAVIADPTGGVFGLWQTKAHPGATIYNQPGAYVWNELHTRDVASAEAFYTSVFDYTITAMDPTAPDTYKTFTVPGGADVAGGIANDAAEPGEGAYWLTWFAVEDADASVAQATGLGASVMLAPMDSPVGRMAVIAGPQGEAFGLIAMPAEEAAQA